MINKLLYNKGIKMFKLILISFFALLFHSLCSEKINIESVVKNIKAGIYLYNYKPNESDEPLVTDMSFRALCDHKIDYETNQFKVESVKQGDSIYVSYHLLNFFTNTIHPKLKYPYVLVTNESTANHPPLGTQPLLYDPKCAAWFSKNMILSNHPKLFQIPVGQSCYDWPDQKRFLPGLVSLIDKTHTKDVFAFLRINNTFIDTRKRAIEMLKDKPFITYLHKKVTPDEYYKKIASSRFVIAPLGGGYDTVRFWESLLLKSIPITTHSPLDAMYNDVPCVIIDDWSELNLGLLKKENKKIAKRLATGEISFRKSTFSYWKNLINSVQAEIRSNNWSKSNLNQTLLNENELNSIKTIFNNEPVEKLYIFGKALALRSLQYCDALSNNKSIICIDDYIGEDINFFSEQMNLHSSNYNLLQSINKLTVYRDPFLEYTAIQIKNNKKPVHVIFDLLYYQYQFLDLFERIWQSLPSDSIISIVHENNQYVKKKIQEFIVRNKYDKRIVKKLSSCYYIKKFM